MSRLQLRLAKAALCICALCSASTDALSYQPPARAHTRAFVSVPHETVDYTVSLWPWPQNVNCGNINVPLDVNFQFVASAPENSSSLVADILADNFMRYSNIIFQNTANSPQNGQQSAPITATQSTWNVQEDTTVLQLMVLVASSDDTLQLGTAENYNLSVALNGTAELHCSTVYGCIRGLETFSQLVVAAPNGNLYVTGVPVDIEDFPRFPHRGLLIDTSRHYLPLDVILQMIDALSYDRANVLHWHMTDAQSFPLLTPSQQNLSLGAWGPRAVYTLTDVRDVVQYARFRGIAVVVEIDTPSHVQSWATGRPDIVLNDTVDPYWSLLNPVLNATYDTYKDVITDLRGVLIDNRFHLGLDEVQFPVLNVSVVNAWMANNGMQAGDYAALVRYYMQKIQTIVMEAGFTYPLWWEEAFDHYGPGNNTPTPPPPQLSHNSVIYLWYCPCWNWANMGNVTAEGYYGIKTDDWYLDDLDNTWDIMYTKDPLNDAVSCDYSQGWANCTCPAQTGCYFNITDPLQMSHTLGGEGCAWGENMDGTMIQGRVWPRMSAIAERLWSPQWLNNVTLALPRLVDHRCRQVLRGTAVEPLQPDYCDGSRH